MAMDISLFLCIGNVTMDTYLLVGVLGDVSPVDVEDLVALVEARDAHVGRGVGRHAGHDDGHPLVSTSL